MRALIVNLAVATWLFISAFVVPQAPRSMAITLVAAVAFAALSIAALANAGARYGSAAVAVALLLVALLLPDVPGVTRLHDGLVAAVMFTLAMMTPALGHREATAH